MTTKIKEKIENTDQFFLLFARTERQANLMTKI